MKLQCVGLSLQGWQAQIWTPQNVTPVLPVKVVLKPVRLQILCGVFLGACFETNIWSDCESSLVSVQPRSCEIATVLPGCFFREEQVSKGSWLTGLGAWSWGWTCCGWGNSRERHCRRIGGAWLCVCQSRSGSGRCCVDPLCLFAVFYDGFLTLLKRRLQPPVLKSAHLKSLNLKARVLES